MPGHDGTGPRGVGPYTGWSQGGCAHDEEPDGPGGRARFGMGRGGAPQGGGRGRCRGGGHGGGRRRRGQPEAPPWTPPRDRTPEGEMASSLEQQLQKIRDRLAELEGRPGTGDE